MYIIGWVYQDSRPPCLSVLKIISKLENLLIKIFSLKQKAKSNTSGYFKKIKFVLFQGFTMSKYKTKVI